MIARTKLTAIQAGLPDKRNVGEVFHAFLRLGLSSFGGPIAHFVFFHRELILNRQWISEAGYVDLVALCQLLPGPASSQVAFALGYLRAGIAGAFAAIIAFAAPSATAMILIAYRFQSFHPGLLQGLKLSAAAVVAQAVWSMATRFCIDRTRLSVAIVSACIILLAPSAWL